MYIHQCAASRGVGVKRKRCDADSEYFSIVIISQVSTNSLYDLHGVLDFPVVKF